MWLDGVALNVQLKRAAQPRMFREGRLSQAGERAAFAANCEHVVSKGFSCATVQVDQALFVLLRRLAIDRT